MQTEVRARRVAPAAALVTMLVSVLGGLAATAGPAAYAVDPPANDDFDNARLIKVGQTIRGTFAGATAVEIIEPVSECLGRLEPRETVWFRLPAVDADVALTARWGDGRQGALAVYQGQSFASLQEHTCNFVYGGGFYDDGRLDATGVSSVDVQLHRGHPLWVQATYAGGWSRRPPGAFSLSLEPVDARPANDDLADATPLELGALLGNSVFATDEAAEPPASCAPPGQARSSVWYRFPAPGGTYRLSMWAPFYDPHHLTLPDRSVLSVVTDHGAGGLEETACDVTDVDFIPNRFDVTAPPGGDTYLRVQAITDDPDLTDGFPFVLRVGGGEPPANDAFADAAPLAVGPRDTPTYADMVGATLEAGEWGYHGGCGPNLGAVDGSVWYRLPDATQALNVGATDDLGNPRLVAVVTGDPTTGFEFKGCGHTGAITVQTTAGEATYLRVATSDVMDSSSLTAVWAAPAAPPPNDDLANAAPLTPGEVFHGDATDAGPEPGEVDPSCLGDLRTSSSVWFRVPAGPARTWELDSVPPVSPYDGHDGTDGQLTVYQGSTLDDLEEVACFAKDPRKIEPLRGHFDAAADTSYLVRLTFRTAFAAQWTGEPYDLVLRDYVPPAPPPNDDLAGAAPLVTGRHDEEATGQASWQPTEPLPSCPNATDDHAADDRQSVWYRLPEGSEPVQVIEQFGEDDLTVYTGQPGDGLADLAETQCVGASYGHQTHVVVAPTAGAVTYLRVSGLRLDRWQYSYVVSAATPPPNDDVAGAILLAPGELADDNATATTFTSGEPLAHCMRGNTLWYRLPPGTASYRLTVAGPSMTFATFVGTDPDQLTEDECLLTSAVHPQSLDITTSAETTTYIQVGGDIDPGPFTMTLERTGDDSVTGTASPGPGTELAYAFDVDLARPGEVSFDVPASLVLDSVEGRPGVACTTEGEVSCTMPAGASHIDLMASPRTAGPHPVRATLPVTDLDPDPDDNVAVVTASKALTCDWLGTRGADRLVGTGADEVLCGLGGDDVLRGGGGDDLVLGGTGVDGASYVDAGSAVVVDLRQRDEVGAWPRADQGPGAGLDRLAGIENVVGSSYDDVLFGDSGDNLIRGRAGNDRLVGFGGTDTLDGGRGLDECLGERTTSC